MTSFFTTGGIRGGKKKLDKFYPRSFNMGIRRDVYQELGGFSKMRFGEDIDFSIRIFKAGKRCRLFPEAWVWHKRRTDFRKFWKQVYNSGIARINLYKKYPESLKLVHLLPMVFTVGTALLILMILFGLFLQLFPIINVFGSVFIMMGLMPLVLYSVIICVDSTMQIIALTLVFSVSKQPSFNLLATVVASSVHGGNAAYVAWMSLLHMRKTSISNS